MSLLVTVELTGVDSGLTAQDTISLATVPAFGTPHPLSTDPPATYTDMVAKLGEMRSWRGYNTPNQDIPTGWPGPGCKPVPPGVDTPVVSIRPSTPDGTGKPDVARIIAGQRDAALMAWFAQCPDGAMVTLWHEIEAKGVSPADAIAMHHRAYGLCKQVAPQVQYGQIGMSYTATLHSSHRPLSQWICPGLDWYGIDAYPALASDTWSTTVPPAVAQIRQIAGSAARIAITESGVAASFIGTPAATAQFFADGWAWSKVNNVPAFIAYFGNQPPSTWAALDPSVVAQLALMNSETG